MTTMLSNVKGFFVLKGCLFGDLTTSLFLICKLSDLFLDHMVQILFLSFPGNHLLVSYFGTLCIVSSLILDLLFSVSSVS